MRTYYVLPVPARRTQLNKLIGTIDSLVELVLPIVGYGFWSRTLVLYIATTYSYLIGVEIETLQK